MPFIRRNLWGTVFLVCFVGCVVTCFASPPEYFWWAILASGGTGFTSLYCFLHPPTPKPFERVYRHEDWQFAAADSDFPRLYIPAAVHRMGARPRLEFRQGDWVFPWEHDDQGNIVVIRNNHSIGRFADLGVIIRHAL